MRRAVEEGYDGVFFGLVYAWALLLAEDSGENEVQA